MQGRGKGWMLDLDAGPSWPAVAPRGLGVLRFFWWLRQGAPLIPARHLLFTRRSARG